MRETGAFPACSRKWTSVPVPAWVHLVAFCPGRSPWTRDPLTILRPSPACQASSHGFPDVDTTRCRPLGPFFICARTPSDHPTPGGLSVNKLIKAYFQNQRANRNQIWSLVGLYSLITRCTDNFYTVRRERKEKPEGRRVRGKRGQRERGRKGVREEGRREGKKER